MKFLRKIPNINEIIAIVVGIGVVYLTQNLTLVVAYFSAILIYLFIHGFDKMLSSGGVRNGLMGFLYLETLDASFSFDGVIGAFALSENIFIIMIGLGVGAMFVRSMTIYLVKKRTLSSFVFLEHGAHYAILALATIMFIKIFTEISEVITGTIGFIFIFVSFLCSILYNKKNDLRN